MAARKKRSERAAVPDTPAPVPAQDGASVAAPGNVEPPATSPPLANEAPEADLLASSRPHASLAELMQHLLVEEFAPAAVLVDPKYEIVYFFGHTSRYLQAPTGAPTRSLLQMARPDLRVKLRVAINRAFSEAQAVHIDNVLVEPNGDRRTIRVTVKPTRKPKTGDDLALVIFRDVRETAPQSASPSSPAEGEIVQLLETELRTTRADLEGTIADLETSNEELTVSNEQAMSLNEELQSANEELQTSQEEYQAINEELNTINQQLEAKVIELETANNDLTNALNGTDGAMVLLDRDLRIRRFNSAARDVVNLIAADQGRPLSHLNLRIDDTELLPDCRRVLHELSTREREIETETGRWWFRRVVPYRTLDNRIEGVVVTWHEFTHIKQADQRARLLATVLMDTNDAIIVHDFQGRISTWNRGAERMYGYSESEALQMGIDRFIPEEGREEMHSVWRRIERGERVGSWEARRVTRDGRLIDVGITLTALTDKAGRPVAIAKIDRDITPQKMARAQLEEEVSRRTAALSEQQQRLRAILDSATDAIVTIDERGTIESVNPSTQRIFGYPSAELIGRNVKLLMPAPTCEEHDGYLTRYLQTGQKRIMGIGCEVVAQRRDGTMFPAELAVSEVEPGKLFTGMIRDITQRKNLEREVVEIAQLEQQRVGQELHDDCGQQLTALALLADSLVDSLSDSVPADARLARKIGEGLKGVLRQVRNISRGLVRAEVEPAGLVGALAELTSRLSETSGVRCTLRADKGVQVKDVLEATHLYHIAQEACNNALRHSQAKNVEVRWHDEAGAVVLEIQDDGTGFVVPKEVGGAVIQNQEGLGLRIMRNRAGIIGAELAIESAPPHGTLVRCTLQPERRHGP
ncbi:MAG TPA: PAS domain S-box protein [Pirellulales bacterium]|nr:PAS domain S-box protein [Pirellulales bacterium]